MQKAAMGIAAFSFVQDSKSAGLKSSRY